MDVCFVIQQRLKELGLEQRDLAAAAQVTVVHGRQIVMHQRIAVYAFQRRARHQGVLARYAEQGGGFDHQEGPEALAATEARIAHSLDQAGRAAGFSGDRLCGQKVVEKGFRLRRNGVEVGKKRAVFRIHWGCNPAFNRR